MNLNKNLIVLVTAVALTLAFWLLPNEIQAETHQKRLLALSEYLTNPTRLSGVEKFCQGVSRTDLINTEEKALAEQYKQSVADFFSVEANKFINDAINGDPVEQVLKIKNPLFVFAGFFIIGFFIFIIQWIFLFCCCCCPTSCPPKCCRKDENEPYTKCELYWPSIFLIVLLALIMAVSAAGVFKADTFSEGLGDFQCSISLMIDDVVNGNVTAAGNYFIGVNPLIKQMGVLETKINDINSSLTEITNILSNGLVGDFNGMAAHIATVPNGTAGQKADITYRTPFNGPYPGTGTVSSSIVIAFGSSTQSGIIKTLYDTLIDTANQLSNNKDATKQFTDTIGNLKPIIGNINTQLASVQSQIKDLDSSLTSSLESMDIPVHIGRQLTKIIYGLMIGISEIALIGVFYMTFCDQTRCRHLMYFSCVLFFFIGILGFLISIIFSIIVPVMFFMCGWLDVTIQSSTFSTNVQKFLKNQDTRNIISSCLIGGKGDIMGSIIKDPQANQTLKGLKESMNLTFDFDTSTITAGMNAGIANMTIKLNKILQGQLLDVLDETETQNFVAITMGLASQSSCAPLAADSFVPSTNYDAESPYNITCQISGGVNVTGSSCSLANFEGNSCHGCIDFSSIYTTHYTNLARGGLNAKLSTRYSASMANPCVIGWVSTFGNLWDNYYQIKHTQVKGIISRWDSIVNLNVAGNDLTKINNHFSNINTTFQRVIASLTSTAETVIDPKYGMLAGMNCAIIGEDLSLVVGSVCVSNFNTIYITRVLMGVASFAILFAMCCIVCSGVRHYKHSERLEKFAPHLCGDKTEIQYTAAAFKSA